MPITTLSVTPVSSMALRNASIPAVSWTKLRKWRWPSTISYFGAGFGSSADAAASDSSRREPKCRYLRRGRIGVLSDGSRPDASLRVPPRYYGRFMGMKAEYRRDLARAFPLGDRNIAVHRQVRESLGASAGLGPPDLQPIEFHSGSQAQHLAHVVRGKIAAAVVLQARALDAAGRPRKARAHRVPVALRALQFNPQPVIPLPAVVSQEQRRAAIVAHQHVDPPVVIEIADRQPASRKSLRKNRPGFAADVAQLAVLLVKEQQRFFVLHGLRIAVDHVVGVAVGQEEIERAIVVIIEESQPPAAQKARGLRHLVLEGDVPKGLVPAVLVEREHFLVHVGDEQILPSVTVEIGGIHAHTRAGPPIFAESHLGRQRDLFPLRPAFGIRPAVDRSEE